MTPPTRRWAAAAACAAVAAVALTGCGDDEPADLSTITMMIPLLGSQAPAADSELQQAIEELIGKELDITWVPNSDYNDRMTVTLASDDLPHVMVVQGKVPAFVQSAQAGAFWDLTDKLGDYPNLTAEDEQILLNSSINGTNYGIFRLRDPMRTAVIVRQDWLDNLGLELPETVDDLYEVARAFTEDDPNDSGEDDTYGLIIPQWPGGYATASPYDVIETWFGAPNGWGVTGGQLVPGFDTPEFLEANRFVKQMIDEGLVNPDFATMDSASWNDPFFNGQGGIIIDVSSRAGVIMNLFKDQDPEVYCDYVAMAGNLAGPDGVLRAYPTIGYNGFLAISRQSVQTEEELAEVLSVLDTLSSQEAQILLNNGIEGRNFTVQDGFAVPVESGESEIEIIANDVTSFAQIGTQSNGYLAYQLLPEGVPERELFEHRLQVHEQDLLSAVHNPAQPLVSETYVTRGAQLDLIIADARIQYLAGQIDEDGLAEAIARWYADGGQQVLDEMNELYAQLD